MKIQISWCTTRVEKNRLNIPFLQNFPTNLVPNDLHVFDHLPLKVVAQTLIPALRKLFRVGSFNVFQVTVSSGGQVYEAVERLEEQLDVACLHQISVHTEPLRRIGTRARY